MEAIDPYILEKAKTLKGRAKIVVDHIIEFSYITTEELYVLYGYKDGARAARDCREIGIILKTEKSLSDQGRSIAKYSFGKQSEARNDQFEGRSTFPKSFKSGVSVENRCKICLRHFEKNYLQIDHRTPYSVAGEKPTRDAKDYMLLCAQCNTKKQNACFNCPLKNIESCKKCYWASPEDYEHVAGKAIEKAEMVSDKDTLEVLYILRKKASEKNKNIKEYLNEILDSK